MILCAFSTLVLPHQLTHAKGLVLTQYNNNVLIQGDTLLAHLHFQICTFHFWYIPVEKIPRIKTSWLLMHCEYYVRTYEYNNFCQKYIHHIIGQMILTAVDDYIEPEHCTAHTYILYVINNILTVGI